MLLQVSTVCYWYYRFTFRMYHGDKQEKCNRIALLLAFCRRWRYLVLEDFHQRKILSVALFHHENKVRRKDSCIHLIEFAYEYGFFLERL